MYLFKGFEKRDLHVMYREPRLISSPKENCWPRNKPVKSRRHSVKLNWPNRSNKRRTRPLLKESRRRTWLPPSEPVLLLRASEKVITNNKKNKVKAKNGRKKSEKRKRRDLKVEAKQGEKSNKKNKKRVRATCFID